MGFELRNQDESWQRKEIFLFPVVSVPALRPTQHPIQLQQEVMRHEADLLLPRLRMHAAIPPLSYICSCMVQHRNKLNSVVRALKTLIVM
jgi:hypothetical protein